VYLVKTPQPVNGTTHHVLKRIAVPNEAMLSEVKKEVDIMARRDFPCFDSAAFTSYCSEYYGVIQILCS
jgi:hypothetical protein